MLNQYRYRGGQFAVSLSRITLEGEDVVSFLQAQSTLNIELLGTRSFHLATFLDPQGRVEAYGWIVREDDRYSFLCPVSLTERSLARLNKFLISEDVTLSDPQTVECFFHLTHNLSDEEACLGTLFDQSAYLSWRAYPNVPTVSAEVVELWRGLTGWPSFDGSDFAYELLNNLRLFDLALSPNKGCYPGQETVSKIATRRGAAYAPVLIETTGQFPAGEIFVFDKKIGSVTRSYEWQGKTYLAASLLRDFRVAGMKLDFSIQGTMSQGFVRYYPLLKGDVRSQAEELYYEATEDFKREDLKAAEEKFKLSIELDPTFADAYESYGVMLGRLERFSEAIELMKKLSEVDPKSVLAHTNMSLYYMRLGEIEKAEEQKSMATVKTFQSFGDEAKKKEQDELREQKLREEWEQRESMFRQVLEIDPEDTLANYGLGSIAVEKADWTLARDHLERVIKQDPKYSVAYLALGKALKGLGLINEAREIWKEGIKVAAAKGDLMPANQMQQELNS